MSVSLDRQVFDVLKDVLIEEMVEENSKLGQKNDELEPVGDALNSKVFLHYLGREIILDLKEAKMGAHLIPIRDVEAVPMLDLAQTTLVSSIFGSIFSGQISLASLAKKVQVEVRLGRIFLGSLETELAGISSAKSAEARHFESRGSFLELTLSPLVRIYGRLTNVSEEDLCDGLKEFNEQINARLVHGIAHASIKNEDSITFTLQCIRLTLHPGMADVVLADFDEKVSEMPETILRSKIDGTLENEEAFRDLLDKNMSLKSTNQRLLATRKWLSTIQFCYNGGSKTLSIEDGQLITVAGRSELVFGFDLLNPDNDGKLPSASCSFNSLREVDVTLGGMTISEGVSPYADVNFETGTIAVRFGHVTVCGGFSGIPENFQFPGNNIHQALFNSLVGQQKLPDEILFNFVALVLGRSNKHVSFTMEILGMSAAPDDESQKESHHETSE